MTKPTSISSRLSQIRQTLFPIQGPELPKFLLIGSIKFFVILALTLTRDTKDTLIVTQCGAEAIAFLKIYGVLPAATLYIAYYSKLSNVLNKKALFYVTCIPFFVFFVLFDVFLYPNASILQPSLATVQSFFGTSDAMAVIVRIVCNWTSALYYIMAEIYSSVSIGLLFWAFANDVVGVEQAKRFYPLFAQMSGLAPVLAGQYTVRYATRAKTMGMSLHRLTAAVTAAGIFICALYGITCRYIERTEGTLLEEVTISTSKKTKKQKPSMWESAKFLAQSSYLRKVSILVLGYGLSINFTEILWKSLVKKQYPDPLDYQRFMGNFSSMVGVSTCIVILLGVQIIRLLGWRVGAMATPAVMGVLSIPFFGVILLGLETSASHLTTAVRLGTILSLLSKTAKYALFDPTTQMAYIPLDAESKTKGKAAIDVLGSRIGKSGGSLIQQFLVLAFGNIVLAAPVVAVIYYSVLLAWMSSANSLAGLFHAKTKEQQEVTTVKKES